MNPPDEHDSQDRKNHSSSRSSSVSSTVVDSFSHDPCEETRPTDEAAPGNTRPWQHWTRSAAYHEHQHQRHINQYFDDRITQAIEQLGDYEEIFHEQETKMEKQGDRITKQEATTRDHDAELAFLREHCRIMREEIEFLKVKLQTPRGDIAQAQGLLHCKQKTFASNPGQKRAHSIIEGATTIEQLEEVTTQSPSEKRVKRGHDHERK